MLRTQRVGILVAGLVAIVVAFVLLKPNDDSSTSTPTTTAPSAAVGAGASTAASTTPARPAPGPLLGGDEVQKIELRKGETVRFRVRSPVAEEVHVHGYDLKYDVPAGRALRVSFPATLTGVFEIEFEDAGRQIASLVVEP